MKTHLNLGLQQLCDFRSFRDGVETGEPSSMEHHGLIALRPGKHS